MRNIRRSVALALAAIMMMAMNMVSFAADTAPAETEAVESVTRSTNGESVLLDKVYFACDGKNTISSREPIPATALDIENRILGSMEYFYDGLDSSGRPQYTVKASMTSNPLKLKSSKLVTSVVVCICSTSAKLFIGSRVFLPIITKHISTSPCTRNFVGISGSST